MIELNGITWDHSRALPPLVAAAQRYEETHPGVRVRWDKRSLHEFGHMPVDILAERFDLVVIDHPWAGFAFERGLFLDLMPLLAEDVRHDIATHSVGPAFTSYLHGERLLAIPIDAASPVPSWRPDLIEAAGTGVPRVWSDIETLARRGLAAMPGFPADLFLNFHMVCHALGGALYRDREKLVDRERGRTALDLLRGLADGMPPDIFSWNPIRLAELMSTTDRVAYCPFAYSYGNYCRPGFARHPLRYGPLPTLDDGRPLRGVVGGTGIAIAARCEHAAQALDFALHTGGASIQRGIYTMAGGQPARREAWTDPLLDTITGGFLRNTLPDHEHAIVRPRYNGYVPLQEQAGVPLAEHLQGQISADKALDAVDAAYRNSLPPGNTMPIL